MLFKYPIVVLLSCLTLVACAGIDLASLLQGEQRIALVVGNGDYQDDDLDLGSPVSDASQMKRALEELGFDVIYLPNANQIQMESAFRKLGEKLAHTAPNRQPVGLFYYSGHGVEYQGKTYLVAVDAKNLGAAKDLAPAKGFVSLASLYKEVNELNRKGKDIKSLFILDNCRDNPFDKNLLQVSANKGMAKAMEGIAKGLKWADDRANEIAKHDPKLLSKPYRNSLVAYATAEVDVAKDGGRGKNSPYTRLLLERIKEPKPLEEILKEVGKEMNREEIQRETGGQIPAVYSTPGGEDFYPLAPTAFPSKIL